jgi:hypothetical protein
MNPMQNPTRTDDGCRGQRLAVLVLLCLAMGSSIKEIQGMPQRNLTTLEVVADRLRHSTNPRERRSVYAGRSLHGGIPVLLDTDQLVEHMHILGPTGTGKTSLAIETLCRQLIPLSDGPLVIFDGKGDMGLFNSVRHMAHIYGRPFKWFTTRPGRSTYVFNPWDQRLLTRLTLPDIVGLITQSLNLHHGQEYGRAWFSVNVRNLLRRAIRETVPELALRRLSRPGRQRRLLPTYGPIQSFRDLHVILLDLTNDSDEFKAAQHLTFIVESLCDFDQLNLAPNTDPHSPALAHAIFMPEVIEKKQIVYFYLAGALDNAAVSEIAKLGLYSLFTAAVDYCEQHGKKPRIYTIWDEAQIMIAKNIEYVLTQSRSNGMACILAHHAMSQLSPPGGADLRDLVTQNTHIKQIFAARDPWLMDYISGTSSTTKYYRRGYELAAADAVAGWVGPAYTCPDRDGRRAVHIQEYTGPRISYQDILNANRHPHVSLMSVAQPSPLCPFRGWFPMYTDWPVPKRLHVDYERQPWPAKSEATILSDRLSSEDDEPTVIASEDEPQTQHEPKADETLDALWEELQRTRAT